MALIKAITNEETNVVCEYWRISHFQTDFTAQVLDVNMLGYVDEATRRADKKPANFMTIRLNAMELLALFLTTGVTLMHLYAAVKDQTPLLSDAGDAIDPDQEEALAALEAMQGETSSGGSWA